MEHYFLQNLALEAFGYYVSDILSRLLTLSKFKDFDSKYFQPTCKFLKGEINKNNVHNYLADNIMEIVLKVMIMKNEFLSKTLYPSLEESISDHQIKKIAVHLAVASTPPTVTTFRYYKFTYPGPLYVKVSEFLELYLMELCKESRSFTEIDLGGRINSKIIPPLGDLEQWTNKNDNDAELKKLASCSKKLWLLDVKYSEINSGQNFVEFILSFHNLIHLDIGWSPLTDETREYLIRGFKLKDSKSKSNNSQVYLRYLGMDLTRNIVKIIPECLPKLTTLDISLTEMLDLLPLKQLSHLTRLSVDTRNPQVQFSCIKNLIKEIGSRLHTLKIYLGDVDLDFISRYCTNLETFGHYISISDLLFSQIKDIRFPIPKFTSVESLYLHMSGRGIWDVLPFYCKCFANLKRMCLFNTRVNEDDVNQSYFFEKFLLEPLKQRKYFECIFNGNTIKLSNERAVITNGRGYSVTVAVQELKQVIMKIEQVGFFNLKRNIRILTG